MDVQMGEDKTDAAGAAEFDEETLGKVFEEMKKAQEQGEEAQKKLLKDLLTNGVVGKQRLRAPGS
eukprot:12758596-Prorocentrum_lima.AAC.1